VLLSAAMAAAGLVLTVHALSWSVPDAPLVVPWWAFVPLTAANNLLVFHLEIHEEAHSFSLSELPLVIGLFFSPPWALILGRLVGEAVYLTVQRRQSPVKLGFNLSLFLLETASAVSVFRWLWHDTPPMAFGSWGLVVFALVVADLISLTAVSLVIRWHGDRPHMTAVLSVSAITMAVNVSLSLLTAAVLWFDPAGVLLIAVVTVVIGLIYRRHTALSQRYASLQILYEFTRAVGTSARAETVMDKVLAEARRLLRAETAEIILVDPDTGRPALRHRNGGGDPETGELALSPELLAPVIRDGRAVVVPRAGRSRVPPPILRDMGVRDLMMAPLLADEAVIGLIVVADRLGSVSTFDDQDRRLFELLANHASVAFANGRLVEQLRREAAERRHEALHDALTGLPNRSAFVARLDAVTAAGEPAAVLLMDLDAFKEVNDTLGHHNGDRLLCTVAARLSETLGEPDMVARLGGDEFAVLLPNLDAAGADATAATMLEAIRAPLELGELSLEMGASIGVALTPEHGTDATTLIQRADVAMYDAKATRGGVAVYSVERDNYDPRRLALAGELRQAIDSRQIVVYFQPKAALSDGRVFGVEALVRWRHPAHGFLPPDQFIPLAEHTGLITPLTAYVLRESLAQCARWREEGLDLSVAVNVAVRNLLDTDLVATVATLLAEHGIAAGHLTLEVTESSIMGDPERTITVLERLAALGVTISVDDFGTGYSSLAYLQRLPVHEVKVDKSFVFRMSNDPNDAAIVRSIVELGHTLGLTVVAEGVEDRMAWDRLAAMSCDVAQGYFLSRPVPAPEISAWLALQAGAEPPAHQPA
jgi:diguanylate cyclase (GGDEF)-like protein